jgi:hypothetical protein
MTDRPPGTPAARAHRKSARAIRVLAELVLPVALYYGLRAAGVGIYLTLLISAVAPAVFSVYGFVKRGRIEGLALYMLSMLVLSTAISFIGGSPRFLLARDAWLTGVTSLWFLVSAWSNRPLTYLYTRPMLERRFGPAGVPWDQLWENLPKFRRLWRISSVLWAIGLLTDALLRVVMAYRLPIDTVPGLGTLLYLVTSAVLIIVTNVCYIVGGLYNPYSRLYAPLLSTRPDLRRIQMTGDRGGPLGRERGDRP